MAVHMFQSEVAYKSIQNAQLKQLLENNKNAWISGTQYPDAGYAPGSIGQEKHVWGEASHWAPFILSYLDVVIEECGGRYLTDAYCGQLTAHFLGAAAHGLQDQVFDSLFIPKVTEIDHKGQETTDIGIDMVLLREHDRHEFIPKPWFTPVDQLETVYQRMGFSEEEANRKQIISATKLSEFANRGERIIAPILYWQYKSLMPWGSRHYMDYPGGVEFGGQATANFWQHLWVLLNAESDNAEPRLIVLPTQNAANVAINKRNTDTQITVTFDRYIIPSSVNNTTFQVRDEFGHHVNGSFSLFASASQDHAEANMIRFRPNETLLYNTLYTVSLSGDVLDDTGSSIFGAMGYTWTFKTEADNNYVQLASQGFCLALSHLSDVNSDIPVNLQPCSDARHYQWFKDETNQWHNRARADLCLQPENSEIKIGRKVVAAQCNNTVAQQWQFNDADGSFQTADGANYALGTFLRAWPRMQLILLPPKDSDRQQWSIIPVND